MILKLRDQNISQQTWANIAFGNRLQWCRNGSHLDINIPRHIYSCFVFGSDDLVDKEFTWLVLENFSYFLSDYLSGLRINTFWNNGGCFSLQMCRKQLSDGLLLILGSGTRRVMVWVCGSGCEATATSPNKESWSDEGVNRSVLEPLNSFRSFSNSKRSDSISARNPRFSITNSSYVGAFLSAVCIEQKTHFRG